MRTENEYREDVVCVCGRIKQVGCVVCWDCFKHRKDITPLKYFEGSIQEWLKQDNILL